ncbi:DUF2252 family protein [Duganella callida]|uniref:DUF2252 domain-containing protein n=1 Tax=Duganella callida TaxID=2561932 RepID=A0A4Y9S7X4_9BURK|nr:DUF2252 family protein [Duganella callida]TFW16592.1 DUF2252 domain-containing protein [Duganella callida]
MDQALHQLATRASLPAPDERRALLLRRRDAKMARSPHAYVRGNTAQYYDWLHSLPGQRLPRGPAIWICGDCHVGNLGPVADAAGKVHLELRDFDQATIGNPTHDLIRLGLSLATAARGSSLPGVVTAHMLQHMLLGYQRAFFPGHEGLVAKPAVVKQALRNAQRRSWKMLARERAVDLDETIPLGKNFWPLSDAERAAIDQLLADPAILERIAGAANGDAPARAKVLDAAYWVKGCSSLGLLRYAVLVDFNGVRRLIDIKEAVAATSPRYPRISMPRDNAKRVVEGASHLSPSLGQRMVARRFMERGVFLRQLMPQDLKLEIEQLGIDDAVRTASHLAYVVGRAHASQMDPGARADWLQALMAQPGKGHTTPDWLWNSVVQLVASHEAGYLEHCRKFALAD